MSKGTHNNKEIVETKEHTEDTKEKLPSTVKKVSTEKAKYEALQTKEAVLVYLPDKTPSALSRSVSGRSLTSRNKSRSGNRTNLIKVE